MCLLQIEIVRAYWQVRQAPGSESSALLLQVKKRVVNATLAEK